MSGVSDTPRSQLRSLSVLQVLLPPPKLPRQLVLHPFEIPAEFFLKPLTPEGKAPPQDRSRRLSDGGLRVRQGGRAPKLRGLADEGGSGPNVHRPIRHVVEFRQVDRQT